MRKIIFPIMWLSIMLALACVNAQWSPLPINGKIIAENPDGLTIKVTMQRTVGSQIITESMNGVTNSAGQYLIEWANSQNKYAYGDVFTVNIVGCSNPKCSQTVTYSGQPELFMTFDLFDVDIPTTSTTTTTIIESCPTCEICDSCNSCCPEITTTICSVCPTTTVCPTCPECPKCPDITWQWVIGGGAVVILGIIAAAVGAYKGKVQIRYYQKYYDPVAARWKYRWVILFSRSD